MEISGAEIVVCETEWLAYFVLAFRLRIIKLKELSAACFRKSFLVFEYILSVF